MWEVKGAHAGVTESGGEAAESQRARDLIMQLISGTCSQARISICHAEKCM